MVWRDNPLIRHFVRCDLRPARLHRSTIVWGAGLGLLTAGATAWLLPRTFTEVRLVFLLPATRQSNWVLSIINHAFLLGTAIWVLADVGRRDLRGKWEHLRLSRLDPGEVLWGFVVTIGLPPLAFSLAFTATATVASLLLQGAPDRWPWTWNLLLLTVPLQVSFIFAVIPVAMTTALRWWRILLDSRWAIFPFTYAIVGLPTLLALSHSLSGISHTLSMFDGTILLTGVISTFVFVRLVPTEFRAREEKAAMRTAWEIHIDEALRAALGRMRQQLGPAPPGWEGVYGNLPASPIEQHRWLLFFDPDSVSDEAMIAKWGKVLPVP